MSWFQKELEHDKVEPVQTYFANPSSTTVSAVQGPTRPGEVSPAGAADRLTYVTG